MEELEQPGIHALHTFFTMPSCKQLPFVSFGLAHPLLCSHKFSEVDCA
jgi:hypothetical protein